MIGEKLTNALSAQINAEYYSAYLYLAMSAYAKHSGFNGFANWLFVQAQEELAHGTHIYHYILDRGAAPSFTAIQQPEVTFNDMNDVFEKVLAHEQKVTEMINNIATLALGENDHACYQFISWYVNEQVEEESDAADIVSKLQMLDGNRGLILSIDSEFATRVFVNPFPQDSKLGGIA